MGELGKARSGVGFPDKEQGGKIGIPFFKVSDMNLIGNENEMTVANNYVTETQIKIHNWMPIDRVPAIFFAKVGAAVMLNRKRLCLVPFLLDNNTMAYSLDLTKWDTNFAKTLFETINLPSLVQVGALPSYNTGDIEALHLRLPSISEQVQIGLFFKYIDVLITLHQRKLEHLKLKKKSLLQKLFPKEGEVYPELRFPGFTDPWEQRELGELANNVTEKNVTLSETETFTNSAELGIISQNSFFDRNITNKDNIDNYYIIQPEDFVYNPRISVTAPVGPINRNKLGRTGIISPLYTVFRPHDINTRYLEYFFKTSKWHSYMRFNGDSGARSDRFSIKLKLFYTMPIPVPSFEEQAEIGRLLERFTESITLHQEESFLHKYML